MTDINQLAEQLVNLSIKDVNELSSILKDKYGLEPAVTAAPIAVAATPGEAAAPAADAAAAAEASVPEAAADEALAAAESSPETYVTKRFFARSR